MKKNIRYAAAALAAITAMAQPLTVLAADDTVIEAGDTVVELAETVVEAGGTTIQTEGTVIGEAGYGYTPEEWARLMDNVMEYDEIADLVHNFNSTITTIWDNLEDTQQQMQRSITELESQSRKMGDLKDSAKDDGDITSQINYATQEAILNAVVSGLRPTTNSMFMNRSTTSSIKKAEEQITQVVQSLMIAYDSLSKQLNTLQSMEEMYEVQYKLMQDEQGLGMVTESQVLAARNNMLSAQSSVLSLQNSLNSLLPTLCTLTGWPADAHPEIAPIPPVDISRIYEMNLEEDTVKAIGNNSTLISQRTSARGDTYDGVNARLGWINEGEEKLAIVMQELYDDVYAKLTAYEAASTGWQAAKRDQQTNQHMYDLGMLSRSEYLATQISYYQNKAAYESADTALLLAIETYNWAVLGLVDVET